MKFGTQEDPEHAAPSDAWTSRQATFTAEGDTAELTFVVGDHTVVEDSVFSTLFLDDVSVQVDNTDAGKYVAVTAQENEGIKLSTDGTARDSPNNAVFSREQSDVVVKGKTFTGSEDDHDTGRVVRTDLPFSVSFKFSTTSTASYMALMDNMHEDNDNGWKIGFHSGSTNKLRFYMSNGEGVIEMWPPAETPTNLRDGKDHSVIARYDGEKIYLRVDGGTEVSYDAPDAKPHATNSLLLGNERDTQGREMTGTISDVVIRPLDAVGAMVVLKTQGPQQMPRVSAKMYVKVQDGKYKFYYDADGTIEAEHPDLQGGILYTFEMTDNDHTDHPLVFKDGDKTISTTQASDEPGNPKVHVSVRFGSQNLPRTMEYQCESHYEMNGMGGKVTVRNGSGTVFNRKANPVMKSAALVAIEERLAKTSNETSKDVVVDTSAMGSGHAYGPRAGTWTVQQSFYQHSATFRDTFLINGKTATQPDEWDMYGMAAMSSPGHKYNFGSLWIATTKGSNFENGEGTCRFGIYGAQTYGDWEELDQFKVGARETDVPLENGDFDTVTEALASLHYGDLQDLMPASGPSTALDGWTITMMPGSESNVNNGSHLVTAESTRFTNPGQARSGNTWVSLAGAELKRTLTGLTANQRYKVSWAERTYTDEPYTYLKQKLTVDVGQVTISEEHESPQGDWVSMTGLFTATSETAELKFTAGHVESIVGYSWIFLDDVKVSSVGHPSEYHEVVESRDGPLSTFVNFEGLESEISAANPHHDNLANGGYVTLFNATYADPATLNAGKWTFTRAQDSVVEASVMYIRNQQTFDLTGHGIVTDPLGGTHCVAISGCTMKTILTGLSVNQSYTVVWREGSRSAQMPFIPAVEPAELTVKIEHNGNTIKERTYDVLHAWASQSITFTATAESADLLFTAARNEERIVGNLALGDRRMAFLSSVNVLIGNHPHDQIYIRRSFENEVAYKWYMVKHLEATGGFAEETDGVEFCKAGPILEIEWGDKISQGRSGYTLAGASEDLAPALSGVKYVTNGQVEDADGNVSEAGPEVKLRLMRDRMASSLIETTTGSRYTIDGGSSGDTTFTIDGTTISLDVPLAKDKSADVTLTMPDPDATNPKWADYEVKPHNWTLTHEIPSSAVYEIPLPEQVTHEDGSVGNFEYVGDPWTLNGTVRIRATFAEDVDVTPFTFEPELKTYQANDLRCEVYIPEGSTKYVVDTTFNVKQDVEHKGTLKMKLGGYTRYYEWMLDQDSQIYSHPMQAENGRTPAQNGLPGTYRNQRGTFATYTFPLNLNEGQLTGRVAEEKNKVKWNGESVPKKDDSNLRELEEGETMSVEGNGMHTGYSTLTAATTAALNTDNVAGIWQRSSGEYYVVERKIASDYPLLGPGKPNETHIKAWEITVDPLSWAMNAENTEITFYNIDKATDSAGRVIGVPIPIEIYLKGPTSEQTLMYSWDLGLAQQYLPTLKNADDPTGAWLKYKTDEQVQNTLHMEHSSFAGASASVTSTYLLGDQTVESNLGARVEENKIIISNLALDVSNGVPSEVALTVNLAELVAIENGDFSQGPATDGHLTLDEATLCLDGRSRLRSSGFDQGQHTGWVGSAAPVVDDQPLFEYLVNLHGSEPTTKSLSTTVRDLVPGNTYELSWWERKRNGAGYGIPYQDREVGVFIGDEAICEFAIIPS